VKLDAIVVKQMAHRLDGHSRLRTGRRVKNDVRLEFIAWDFKKSKEEQLIDYVAIFKAAKNFDDGLAAVLQEVEKILREWELM